MRRRIDNEGDMSRMAHTPGPWHVEDEFVFDKRGLRVADTITADGQDGISDEEADANALLIAAAPELLVALRACEAFLSQIDDTEAVCLAVNANTVIAKAEGRD